MTKPLSRLLIAQRLYPALLREIGHAIEIERLLSEPRYARDVLLVCEACPDGDLPTLAAQFRACAPMPVVQADWPPHSAGTPARVEPAPDQGDLWLPRWHCADPVRPSNF